MNNKHSVFIAVFICVFLQACTGGNPTENFIKPGDSSYSSPSARNTSRGEYLFRQHCVTCHGLNGSYRNNNAADLQMTRLDSLGIANTIKYGKNPMPMFAGTLQDSDIAQLVLYVKTLRK